MPPPAHHLDKIMDGYLCRRSLSFKTALHNRWYPSIDAGDTVPRVIIPATNTAGFPYWQARALQPAEVRYQSPHGVSRLDSHVLVFPLPHRQKIDGPAVIVEGPMDALAAATLGYTGIATMGALPSESVVAAIAKRIKSAGSRALVVADADATNPAVKIASGLSVRGVVARVVQVPGGNKDLADALPSQREECLARN